MQKRQSRKSSCHPLISLNWQPIRKLWFVQIQLLNLQNKIRKGWVILGPNVAILSFITFTVLLQGDVIFINLIASFQYFGCISAIPCKNHFLKESIGARSKKSLPCPSNVRFFLIEERFFTNWSTGFLIKYKLKIIEFKLKDLPIAAKNFPIHFPFNNVTKLVLSQAYVHITNRSDGQNDNGDQSGQNENHSCFQITIRKFNKQAWTLFSL